MPDRKERRKTGRLHKELVDIIHQMLAESGDLREDRPVITCEIRYTWQELTDDGRLVGGKFKYCVDPERLRSWFAGD